MTFSSDANPLSFLAERFYQRAASRTIAGVDLGTVAGIVLMLIALDLIFTFLLVGGTAIGKRSYEEDNSWSSWLGLSSMTGVMRNVYNRYNAAHPHLPVEQKCSFKNC